MKTYRLLVYLITFFCLNFNIVSQEWEIINTDNFEVSSNFTLGDYANIYQSTSFAYQGSYFLYLHYSGIKATCYYTNSIDLNSLGYSQVKLDFWATAYNGYNNDGFYVQYFDGNKWIDLNCYIIGKQITNGEYRHFNIILDKVSHKFSSSFNLRFIADGTYYIFLDNITLSGKTDDIQWNNILFNNFSMDNFNAAGAGAQVYYSSTNAHNGVGARSITDNNALESSFYLNKSIDIDNIPYNDLLIDFWYLPLSMENGEYFAIEYFNGTIWQTVKTYYAGTDFINGEFYNESITLNESIYNFPQDMNIRFTCYASSRTDYVMIDEIKLYAKESGNDWELLVYDDFESIFQNFTPGGSNAGCVMNGFYAHDKFSTTFIQGNSGLASSIYLQDDIALETLGYNNLKISFWYYPVSMETGEQFQVQYFDGSNWNAIATLISGTDFTEETFYYQEVFIDESMFPFPDNANIRFMCQASASDDQVFIDEVKIDGATVVVPVTNVTLDLSEATVLEEEEFTLIPTISPSNATNTTPNWSSSDPLIADVDANGQVTAVAPGTVTIRAEAADDPGIYDECTVTVLPRLDELYIDPDQIPDMIIGQSLTLSPVLVPANAANSTVSWSTTDQNIVTVDQLGQIQAIANGLATISLSSVDDPTVPIAQIPVTVAAIGVSSVTISTQDEPIFDGQTRQLDAQIAPLNATNQALNWSSENTDIATVDADGFVTAVSVGTTTIRAISQDNTAAYDDYTLVVEPVIATGVIINIDNPTELILGGSLPLDATVLPPNATDKSLTWSIVAQNPDNIITLDENGLVQAIDIGQATVQCVTHNNIEADITINVVPIPVTDFILQQTFFYMALNQTINIEPILIPSNATPVNVEYTPSQSQYYSLIKDNANASITAIQGGDEIFIDLTIDGLPTQTIELEIINALYGDVNLNGTVTVFDAALILQFAVGGDLSQWNLPAYEDWEAERVFVSDVYHDAAVDPDVLDAYYILQATLGKVELPVESNPSKSKPHNSLQVFVDDSDIVFVTTDKTDYVSIDLHTNDNIQFFAPEKQIDGAYIASNGTAHGLKTAIICGESLNAKTEIMRIPYSGSGGEVSIDMKVNSMPGSMTLNLGAATSRIIPQNQDIFVNVYPNPAQTRVHFELENLNLPYHVKIFDIAGQLIETLENTSNNCTWHINKGEFKSGAYFYTIYSKNNVVKNGKIIVR